MSRAEREATFKAMTPATEGLRLTRDMSVRVEAIKAMAQADRNWSVATAIKTVRALSAALVAPCGECEGHGWVRVNVDGDPPFQDEESCPTCNGSGEGMSLAEAIRQRESCAQRADCESVQCAAAARLLRAVTEGEG
jgi:hypothetical protein